MKGLHNAALLLLSTLLSVQQDRAQAQVMDGDLPAVGAVVESCSLCPNGVNINEDTINGMIAMGNDDDMMDLSDPLLLCEQTLESSKMIEADSDMCLEMKFQTEMMCCPTLATNPCPICPNGISSGGDNPFFSLFGAMGEGLDDNSTDVAGIDLSGYDFCELAVDSGRFMEADSDMCQEAITGTSFLCCPEGVIEGACTFCPDGITADENYYLTLGFNETEAAEAALGCQQMAGLVQMFEAGTEECNGMGIMAVSCCPGTQVEVEGKNPCTMCPNGIVPIDEHPFIEYIGDDQADQAENHASCAPNIAYYAQMYEADSSSCLDMKPNMEMMCCPIEHENPCLICPSGITVSADDEIYDQCNQNVQIAKVLEAGTEDCGGYQVYEALCCPDAAANPCSLCPEGYALNEDAVIESDDDDGPELTCGISLFLEEGSQDCEEGKQMDLQSICCSLLSDPTSPADPVETQDTATSPTKDNLPTNATTASATYAPTTSPPLKEPATVEPPGTGAPTEPAQASESPTSAAPTMGILASVPLLLVTTHAFAWTV